MLDQKSIDHLIRLKEALDREPHVSDSDESDTDITTNRGNKLKRTAEDVHRTKLPAPPLGNHRIKIVEYNGVRRPVIYKRRRYEKPEEEEEEHKSEEEESSSDDGSNPYHGIHLEEILAPLTHPADLPHHKSMARTCTSTTLRTLATRALDVICQEQKHVVQFMKLMSVFLGDDPSFILADQMQLPDYETENGDEDEVPRRTRQEAAAAASQEIDPFFALPQIPCDRDFGISRDAAEETRQLTQIALQRCEEFIRCITSVRMGLLRADRFRDQVYRWCKEMSEGTEGDKGQSHDAEE